MTESAVWPQGKPTGLLSACIIAKDAEKTIGQVIASVADCAEEVCLVVDDRTRDRTEDAAHEAVCRVRAEKPHGQYFGLYVFKRPWTHNFSEARNASIDMANGEYCLILDADDVLAPGDGRVIREALEEMPADAPVDLFTCPTFLKPSYGAPNYYEEGFGQCGISFRNRIFRKTSGARYQNRVHEQLLFPGDCPMREEILGARFYHLGEMSQDKHDYYWALLTLDHIDHPDNPIPAIMLADRHLVGRDAARAARLLSRVDIETVRAPGTRSRYWIAKGKVCQLAFMKALVEEGARKVVLAEEAFACYQTASAENPAESEGDLHAAIIAFVGLYDKGQAVGILQKCLEKDPSCICASEMLDLYRAYGTAYGDFLRRLGVYLAHMGNVEQRAALAAEGYAADAGRANQEQMAEILSIGKSQADPDGRTTHVPAGTIVDLADFKMGDR